MGKRDIWKDLSLLVSQRALSSKRRVNGASSSAAHLGTQQVGSGKGPGKNDTMGNTSRCHMIAWHRQSIELVACSLSQLYDSSKETSEIAPYHLSSSQCSP